MKFIDRWKLILNTYSSALKEISMYGSSQIIIQGSSFLAITMVSRYLGPTNLGLYSFAQSYMSTSLVIIGGFDFFYSWQLAKSNDRHNVVKNYLLQKLSVMAIILTPAIVFAYISFPTDVFYLSLSTFIPIIFYPFTAFWTYAQIDKRAKLVSIAGSVAALLSLIIKVVLVYLHAPLIAFAFMAGFDLVIGSVLVAIVFLSTRYWRNLLLTPLTNIRRVL
jgi:PST family polysaccharide transporter